MGIYRCPYCFAEHKLANIEFRCVNYSGDCKEEPDEKFARYKFGQNVNKSQVPLKAHVFPPKISKLELFTRNLYMPVDENCNQCKTLSNIRLCPSCHNTLPPNVENMNDNILISVVGSYASGKSHYISTLINELQKHVMPDMFGTSFVEVNKEVRETYAEKYYNPLYEEGTVLEPTKPNERQEPLIYEATIKKGSKEKQIQFMFYDVAAENLGDINTMVTMARHIGYSDGIILLVDPLQIGEIRNQLPEKVLDQNIGLPTESIKYQTPDVMIKYITKVVQQYKKIYGNKKIDGVPVAVTLSKLDTIFDFLPLGSVVKEMSGSLKKGAYDREEIKEISTELKDFINTYDKQKISKVIESNFAQVAYFGVSALGDSPIMDEDRQKKMIHRPKPHRVEEPFLWILDQLGVIS